MAASTPLLAHIHQLVPPSGAALGTAAEMLHRFIGSVLVLIVGVVAGGISVLVQPHLSAQQQAEKQTTTRATGQSRPEQEKPRTRTDRYGDPLPPGAIARLGTIRLRPGNNLLLIACLPDGKTFLSVSVQEERTIVCRWRLATGELIHHFETPMRVSGGVAVSRDGKTLVMSGYTRPDPTVSVRLWDISSGKPTGKLEGLDIALPLAFAPDGKTIAIGCKDKTLRLWDRTGGREIRRCKGAQDFCCQLVFSPDGKILASASRDRRKVHLWDPATGQELRVLEGDPGERPILAFSANGKLLATAAERDKRDKMIRLWDTATGKKVREIQGQPETAGLAFSPDGKLLASGGVRKESESNSIYLWEVNTGREVRHFPGHLSLATPFPFDGVMALAFSGDSKWLISGGGDNVLRVWDVAAGKELLLSAEHEDCLSSVAFSPDGRFLATGGANGTIRLWQPAMSEPGRLFGGERKKSIWNVSFSSDGRSLVSCDNDCVVRFWDVAARREIRQLRSSGDNESMPVLSPDGRILARWPQGGAIRLLDGDTGAERRRLIGSEGPFGQLHFSPDGKRLASLKLSPRDLNGVLQLWDVAAGKELHKWKVAYVADIIFSPDGRELFGIDDYFDIEKTRRTFHVWDVVSGEDQAFIAVLPSRPMRLTVSPDGRMLAWGDAAGAVTLWELAANQVRRSYNGHHARVTALGFSPDGKTIASGSEDTTALLWDDLARKDASKAFEAIRLLTALPEQAVPLLKSKLRPAPAATERRQVNRLIADLDSDDFTVRQKAIEELRQLGESAEPGLRDALQNKPALEARKRIEDLLEIIRALGASPERLRELRSIEVLEHLGTGEARRVLKTLAEGAAHARLTREAQAALKRLTHQ